MTSVPSLGGDAAPRQGLGNPPGDLIAGRFSAPAGGSPLISRNPAQPDDIVWSGRAHPGQVDAAVGAAREAAGPWSRWPRERRFAVLAKFRDLCKANEGRVADLICSETGKVMWDARAEAGLLASKVDITLDASDSGALRRVSGYELPLGPTRAGRCWFRPHGVMAVVGPYNFPAHLPNGHIVPALAMGNTVVFKPSDKTPAVGQLLGELLNEALRAEGAPPGVVNVVQGGADVASALVRHAGIDGILFTGSWPVGRSILEANLDRPGRIVALEMGGNNPAIVLRDADLRQAVIECVRSAFVSTGQRCTCTRRLIIEEPVAGPVIAAVCKAASNLIVGHPRSEHPVFMGPMISEAARASVLEAQRSISGRGGEVLVESTSMDLPGRGWFLSPGVIRVDRFSGTPGSGPARNGNDSAWSAAGEDREVFGPLLRISVVRSLDDAIEQANATAFGLAASVFTKSAAAIDRFLSEAQAGCANVNTGTAGASSKLPFGGLGRSGNHRPAGAFSLDYCAYPVAGMMESGDAAPIPTGMRFEDSWIR